MRAYSSVTLPLLPNMISTGSSAAIIFPVILLIKIGDAERIRKK